MFYSLENIKLFYYKNRILSQICKLNNSFIIPDNFLNKTNLSEQQILNFPALQLIQKMNLLGYLMTAKYQLYLSPDYQIDSRISPKQLIKELANQTNNYSNLRKFTKTLHKPTSNSNKLIRRLHVINLILLYSDIFSHQFFHNQPLFPLPLSTDKWLNDQLIKPYSTFLQKAINEYELFNKCTKSLIDQSKIFDQLFFIINLLKLLFKAINKLPLMGKFYRSKHPTTWQGVIEMIAIQAKQLYFTFKNILILILQNTQKYLFTEELQKILKNILMEDLALINEEMKTLLLGKQFFPYGKGIGIKLFRIDEATQELQDTMRGIVTDHCQTNRRLEKEWIEGQLFDKGKGFNVKFFEETLGMGVSKSQPLLFKAFGKKNLQNKDKKMSQQVVMSQSDQQQNDPQMFGKKLADTNQSNYNKEGKV